MEQRSWVEIDLGALSRNFEKLSKLVSPSRIAPVVKSNAYGHGLVKISKALEPKVDLLVVGNLEEALKLREAGIQKAILILLPLFDPLGIRETIRNGFTFSISSKSVIPVIENEARKLRKEATVHLEIDTGMSRTGIAPEEFDEVIAALMLSPYVRLKGIYTHFACAENDLNSIERQLDLFLSCVKRLPDLNSRVELHASNSAGLVVRRAHLDFVRIGISLYGLYPNGKLRNLVNLEPVLSLKTYIFLVKRIKKGQGVSYGHTFIAPRDMKIAVLGIGYGDGYMRQLSNKADVIIKGRRARIVGNITMDFTMVDVSHIEDVREGDVAVIIGKDGDERVTADELAAIAGTINYHVLTSIRESIPRFYIDEEGVKPLTLFSSESYRS